MLLTNRKRLLVAVTALTLGGCAASPDVKKELAMNTSDPALARLAASAENVQKHWDDIAAMESATYQRTHGNSSVGFNPNLVPDMQRMISLGDEWTGPVEPLVREIASLTDYKVRVLGVKPAADVFVTVDTSYRRAIDMLADAGYQAGKRAAIKVLAKDRVIEVEYAKY